MPITVESAKKSGDQKSGSGLMNIRSIKDIPRLFWIAAGAVVVLYLLNKSGSKSDVLPVADLPLEV